MSTAAGRLEIPWNQRPDGTPFRAANGAQGRAGETSGARSGAVSAGPRRIWDTALLAGPLAFLVTTAVLEALQPGYDRVRETISSLVWGQGGWAQAVAFFLFGLTMVAFARRLGTLSGGRASNIGKALVGLVGLGFMVIAIFPTSPPLQGPGIVSSIHHLTVRVMSVLFPIACVFVAKSFRGDSPRRGIRTYTLVTAAVSGVLVPVGAVAIFTDASWLGAFERLMLGNGLLWVEVIGIQLCLGQGIGLEWISALSLLKPKHAVLRANRNDCPEEAAIDDSREVRKNERGGRRVRLDSWRPRC